MHFIHQSSLSLVRHARKMKLVWGDVFIGNREDALSCLTENGDIKHILTIESEPLHSTEENEDFQLKHVKCLDEPEADLLSYLDDCIQFIQDGVKNSKVLVHCSAGVSRSATVVLAFMMKVQNIDLNEALDNLEAAYPKADPNPGFLYQLQLFEAMGKKVDTSNSLYKQFRLHIIANDLKKTGCQQLPDEILENLASNPGKAAADLKEKHYKCRKCRFQLFKSSNCLIHKPGTGQEFLPWYSKSLIKEENNISESNCTSYFIEPVKWMMPLLVGTTQGKVSSVLVGDGLHLPFNFIRAELMTDDTWEVYSVAFPSIGGAMDILCKGLVLWILNTDLLQSQLVKLKLN